VEKIVGNIPDQSLRLLLLQSAWTEGLLPPFDKEAFFRDVVGEEWDDQADYNDAWDKRVSDALLAIPLTDEILGKIKSVEWDGGKAVFGHIWSNWDGESGEFHVHDLTGIDACTHLADLTFIGGVAFTDLTPLAGLKNLVEFSNYSRPLPDLRPLLNVPKLKKLHINYTASPQNDAVLAELKKRGVAVTTE